MTTRIIEISILIAALAMVVIAAVYHWRKSRRDRDGDLFEARCQRGSIVLTGRDFRISKHEVDGEPVVILSKRQQ